jgi:glycosyltransferase involved in cell wall biosynthesis
MPYKILMIAPTPFFADRGCHVRILEEIQALQKLGHTITLCTYHIGRDIPGIDIRRIMNIPWYNKLEAGPSWHKFYLDELLYRKAKSILKKERFDIIHAHLHEGALISARLRKRFHIPVVADLQGSLTDEVRSHGFARNNRFVMKIFQYAEKKINQSPDMIILSSRHFKEVFEKEFQVSVDKMKIVSDGVETPCTSNSDKQKTREKLGIPEDRTVAVFMGLLTTYQGIDLLMEIMPSVIRENPKIHFLIIGFPNEEQYMKRCQEAGISDHVTWTGRLPYHLVEEYLSCADVALSPKISKTEGNVKLMHYMAMGLPTVVFDTPVNREILEENGIYAEYGNANDFAQKLSVLSHDPTVRQDLKGKLISTAQERFSWKDKAKQILGVYEKLLNRAVISLTCLDALVELIEFFNLSLILGSA